MQVIIQSKTALPDPDSMPIDVEQQSLKISDIITQVTPESSNRQSFHHRLLTFKWLSAMCSCFRSAETAKPSKPSENQSSLNLLTPQVPTAKTKKTLVLDLDETLVHSAFKEPLYYDIHLQINIDSSNCEVYVLKRPGVDEFIRRMSEIYEIVLFTASIDKVIYKQYADPLLDILDSNHYISSRLYRSNCTNFNGSYVKDLSKLGRSLKDVIIIDNSAMSYLYQPDNALPIKSWFEDPQDRELLELVPVLEFLADLDDVTESLSKIRKKRGISISGRQICEILGLEDCSVDYNGIKALDGDLVLHPELRNELNSPIYRRMSSKVFKFKSSDYEDDD